MLGSTVRRGKNTSCLLCPNLRFPPPVYIDIGANAGDTASFAFAFDNSITTTNRLFDIKVTQIECDNPGK